MIRREKAILADLKSRAVRKSRLRLRHVVPAAASTSRHASKRQSPRAPRGLAAGRGPRRHARDSRGSWRALRGVGRLSGGAQRQAAVTSAPWKLEPVAARDRGRLVGEADRVERREEEAARLVAREHPPRPVGAVSRGREPHDEDPPPGVAERRQGFAQYRWPAKRRGGLRAASSRHATRRGQRRQEMQAHFLAGSPLGTPIERQRFFFSSQSSRRACGSPRQRTRACRLRSRPPPGGGRRRFRRLLGSVTSPLYPWTPYWTIKLPIIPACCSGSPPQLLCVQTNGCAPR